MLSKLKPKNALLSNSKEKTLHSKAKVWDGEYKTIIAKYFSSFFFSDGRGEAETDSLPVN
jgi:hypothetical protein